MDDLQRWVADAVARQASESRTRTRVLLQQAEEDATLSGVLVDLAEQSSGVAVVTAAGNTHPGEIAAVGSDFCVVWTRRDVPVFVPLRGLVAVRAQPGTGHHRLTGDRPAPLGASFGAVLGGVAAERPRVQVHTVSHSVTGELRAAGLDVVFVNADGDPPQPTYLPLTAVSELSVLDVA
jgi:hypothetical protein